MKKTMMCLAATVAVASLNAVELRVDATGAWENSYTTLDEALAHAQQQTTILIRPGTYSLTAKYVNSNKTITMRSCDENGNIDREHTIIDGSACPGRGFYFQAYNGAPTIKGLTFRNFTSNGAQGGVIYLENCGGGIYDCIFENNLATNCHGGAVAAYVSGTISNCVFRGNRSIGTDAYGGAVHCQTATDTASQKIMVYDSYFTNNYARGLTSDAKGGALYSYRCTYLYDSVFEDNLCRTDAGSSNSGGQIYLGCYSKMERCTVRCGKTPISAKGAYYGSMVSLNGVGDKTIRDCTFGPITAGTAGYGFIGCLAGSGLMENCRFRGISIGGDLFYAQQSFPMTMRNCLVTDCALNGARFVWRNGAGTWTLENCTILKTADNGSLQSDVTYVNCLANATTTAANVTNSVFLSSRFECKIEGESGGYVPKPDSPAIDAGTALAWHDGATDLFGRARVVNVVDAGAVERQPNDVDASCVRVVADPSERVGEWAAAMTNVVEALAAVEENGSVLIKAGEHVLASPLELGTKSVEIVGCEGAILDAQGNHRVVYVDTSSTQKSILVERLVLKNGAATGSGGGVYAKGGSGAGSVSFAGCLITNCTATGNGGGIYADRGVVFTNCTVVGNSCTGAGGGAYVSGNSSLYYSDPAARRRDTPTLEDCRFAANSAGTTGGGIYGNLSFLADRCVLDGNRAPGGDGGNVYCGSGSWYRDCRIVNGSSKGDGYGSNVMVNNTDNRFTRTEIGRKSGSSYGNIWFGWQSDRTLLEGCILTNGGYICQGVANFRNCLGNQVQTYSANGKIRSENCTWTSGVSWWNGGTHDLVNCINCGSAGGNIHATNTCFTAECAAAEGREFVNCFVSANPGFKDAANGDHSLRPGSACREKGLLLGWMTADSVDLAGNPRVVDRFGKTLGVNPAALPDLGCYEAQDTLPGMSLIVR